MTINEADKKQKELGKDAFRVPSRLLEQMRNYPDLSDWTFITSGGNTARARRCHGVDRQGLSFDFVLFTMNEIED